MEPSFLFRTVVLHPDRLENAETIIDGNSSYDEFEINGHVARLHYFQHGKSLHRRVAAEVEFKGYTFRIERIVEHDKKFWVWSKEFADIPLAVKLLFKLSI